MVTTPANADDGTNFFLKASKSVPRIGRRSDFYLKNSKPSEVPRIGRRRTLAPLTDNSEWAANNGWPWYRNSGTLPGPSKKGHEDFYIRKDGQPLKWSEIDRALEESPDMWVSELYRTHNGISLFEDDDDDALQRMRRAAASKELDETRSQAEV
ncbi:uncharacterized protein ETH [Anabrus simplex]|uniref:uncharacterized protein ETH n=1 Tax=Anabrus simplex TaxID=316456 RepID=UPI0034DDC4BF